MRAFGGPEVLSVEPVPEPMSRPGWVTVRLEASALNWHDVLVRRGQYGSPLPHVPGADGAGVRTDTGEPVVLLPSLFWGDREAAPGPDFEILGDHRPGTCAELVSVPEECAVPRPPGLDPAQAAAFGLVGVTTWRALFPRGRLVAGEHVLVLGASGGVASYAVSLARAAGARVVVTSGDRAKVERAVELGAEDGVDHTSTTWVDDACALTPGGRGFDLVLDPVGRWNESIGCLRSGGRLVALGASVADEATIAVRPWFFGQYELIGTTMGSPRDFTALVEFVRRNDVPPPVVDRTFALHHVADAHRHLESGSGFGKVVLVH
jgi:zinc-binding alcohol dehydrogenase/oxidoreductase